MTFMQKPIAVIRLEMEKVQANIVALETAQNILESNRYNTGDIEKYLRLAYSEINSMKKAIELNYWNEPS